MVSFTVIDRQRNSAIPMSILCCYEVWSLTGDVRIFCIEFSRPILLPIPLVSGLPSVMIVAQCLALMLLIFPVIA